MPAGGRCGYPAALCPAPYGIGHSRAAAGAVGEVGRQALPMRSAENAHRPWRRTSYPAPNRPADVPVG